MKTVLDLKTREVFVVSDQPSEREIAYRATKDAEIAAAATKEAAELSALFSAARALDPLPSPYSQNELNAKVEGLITLIRRLHPELVRGAGRALR